MWSNTCAQGSGAATLFAAVDEINAEPVQLVAATGHAQCHRDRQGSHHHRAQGHGSAPPAQDEDQYAHQHDGAQNLPQHGEHDGGQEYGAAQVVRKPLYAYSPQKVPYSANGTMTRVYSPIRYFTAQLLFRRCAPARRC